MSFISIHDTHKLPYFNATITAKTKQSGNTSPLKFKTCLDGTELGYTVYTNARGYLCDHDGNLYTDSVCVSEDAYITATMPDGASTSWIVRCESDITVNDGMLLGRAVSDAERESLTGKTFVKVEGVWRILLHSANTSDDRTLPLSDLDEVPAFNEWKEVQEVVKFSQGNTHYDVGEYAKSLVIQWEGSVPNYPNPINITLGYANADGRKRYAQNVMVYNSTPYRVTLIDSNSGSTVGSINPGINAMNIGLFFTESDTLSSGNWRAVDDELAMDSNGKTETVGSGTKVIKVTDRTPELLPIDGAALTLSSMTREIKLKIENLTRSRKIRLWWRGVGGLRVVDENDNLKFEIRPNGITEIYVDYYYKYFEPLNNYEPSAFKNNGQLSLNAPTGKVIRVPAKCDQLVLTTSELNSWHFSKLIFPTESQDTTVVINNNTAKPIGYAVYSELNGHPKFWILVTPNSSYSCVVSNRFSLITCPTASPNGMITEEEVPRAGGSNRWFVRYPSGIYGGIDHPVNCSLWHISQVINYPNLGKGANAKDDVGLMLPLPLGAQINDLCLLVKNYQKSVGTPKIRLSVQTYEHNDISDISQFEVPEVGGITLANLYRFNLAEAPEDGEVTMYGPGMV